MITQSVGVPFTYAGLVEFRRHHPHVIGQRLGDAPAGFQAVGMDAVVVGYEDAHNYPDKSRNTLVILRGPPSAGTSG
jgi:hypothetical protein